MKTVLLTGATGFVGSHFLQKFAQKYKIIASYRSLSLPLEATWLQLDLTSPADFTSAAAFLASHPPDYLIHLGGSTPNRAYADGHFRATINGTRRLVTLAQSLKVKKIIYLSSYSVQVPYNGPYKLSKLAGEAAILSSGINFTILRPTFILGQGATDFSRLLHALKTHPVFPLLSGPSPSIQPISVDNLIDVIDRCLTLTATDFQIIPVLGKDSLPQIQFLRLITALLHTHPTFLPIPRFIAFPIALILGKLYPRLGLNPERLHLQLQSVNVDVSAFESLFGLHLDDLDTTLSKIL